MAQHPVITHCETLADRRTGFLPEDTTLYVYGCSTGEREPRLLGVIRGYPDKLSAMQAGDDLVAGRMAFHAGDGVVAREAGDRRAA